MKLILIVVLVVVSNAKRVGGDDEEGGIDRWLLLGENNESPQRSDGPDAWTSDRRNAAIWCTGDSEEDSIYVYGGKSPTADLRLNELWKYEVPTHRWLWLADPPFPLSTDGGQGGRSGMAYWSDSEGSTFWLYGGRNDGNPQHDSFDDLWSYDRFTRKWTKHEATGAGGPGPQYGALFWFHQNSQTFYILGGSGGGNSSSSSSLWSLEMDGALVWNNLGPLGNLPPGLNDAYASVLGEKGLVYIFGGQDANGMYLDDFYELDLTRMELKKKPTGPSARGDHIMWFNGAQDKLYVFGGRNKDTGVLFGDTWSFDLTTEEWTQLEDENDSPAPRWGATICEGHDEVLLFGGATLSSSSTTNGESDAAGYNDVWKYGNVYEERGTGALAVFFQQLKADQNLAASSLAAAMSTLIFTGLLATGIILWIKRCRDKRANFEQTPLAPSASHTVGNDIF